MARELQVKRPEDYRWSSLGYHIQTGNKDDFLSLDFGLKEFGVMTNKERLRYYRKYVYEAGALDLTNSDMAKVIDSDIIERERQKNYEISRIDRFMFRSRYFPDSGIIGTKGFVSRNYRRFKDKFISKRDKIPKPVGGRDGMFSLKRLVE